MAKPILVVKLKQEYDKREYFKSIKELLKKELNDEYHVIITADISFKAVSFECFNDCKGLPDIDIEQLIKDFENGK